MKSVFPLLLLCSLAQGAAYPNGQPKDEATLVQVEHEWLRAVEQHDMAALGCILADEFEEADFAGSLMDRRAMLRSAANLANDHYELADLHAHVYGDFAYVRRKGVSNANGVRTAKTRFTDIFGWAAIPTATWSRAARNAIHRKASGERKIFCGGCTARGNWRAAN